MATEPADLEAERLARRIQQASSTPWRLDNARRDTREAIRRAGIAAAHAEAERLRGAGLPAWQVRQRLEALTAPPSAGASIAPPVTVKAASPAVAFALRMMEQTSPSVRSQWHHRACRAGATARMFTAEGWVPFIAADFLSADHPRAWEAFQARAAAEACPCSA